MTDGITELGNHTDERRCRTSIKRLRAARTTAVPGAFRTTIDEMIVVEHERLRAVLDFER